MVVTAPTLLSKGPGGPSAGGVPDYRRSHRCYGEVEGVVVGRSKVSTR